MELLQSLILGIIQGASEFLPISSSGHLYIIPKVLGWEGVLNSTSFDVALHIGTMLAVVLFFWRDWLTLFLAFLKAAPKGYKEIWQDANARVFVLLIIGSIPAAFLGLIFKDFFENEARNLPLVAFSLIIFGLLLFWADRIGQQTKRLENIGFIDGVSIGLAQALALMPGVSRSGITITSGLFRNLNREAATKFSFLLSTPAIVGASLLESRDISEGLLNESTRSIFIVGFLAAAISGFLAIKILLRFVQTNSFTVFVVYRILLGIAILIMLIGI